MDSDTNQIMISSGFVLLKCATNKNDKVLPLTLVKFGFEKEASNYFSQFEIPLDKIYKVNLKLHSTFISRHVNFKEDYSNDYCGSLYESSKTLPAFITMFQDIPDIKDFIKFTGNYTNKKEDERKGRFKYVSKYPILCTIVETNDSNVPFGVYRSYLYVACMFGYIEEKVLKPMHVITFQKTLEDCYTNL